MPTRLRNLLLVLALAGFLFAWAAAPDGDRSGRDAGLQSARATIEHPKPKRKRPSLGQRAAKIALTAVGVPYRWGGASPSGFDCSGLVYWAYGRLGVELPHSSYALYGLGRRVGRGRMKPGDLLFFSGLGHVGLYVGRGLMVHAPHAGRNVEVVSLRGSSYGSRLVGARRIARA